MLKATQNPDVILDTEDGAFIPRGNSRWPEDESVIVPLPAPTANDVIARFLPQLQAMLDSMAQQNGYDSAISCISYAGCGVAAWEADATAMKAYRTALWTWGYAQIPTLNAMTPEQIAALTLDSVLAQAPKPADSGWVVHGGA